MFHNTYIQNKTGVAESGDDFTKFSTISQCFQTLIHPALMQRHKTFAQSQCCLCLLHHFYSWIFDYSSDHIISKSMTNIHTSKIQD
ncbi:MAG: hypothetical protein HRU34_12225 [Richelia sp.]|nr:hypothetical protein [Richelia sp.]